MKKSPVYDSKNVRFFKLEKKTEGKDEFLAKRALIITIPPDSKEEDVNIMKWGLTSKMVNFRTHDQLMRRTFSFLLFVNVAWLCSVIFLEYNYFVHKFLMVKGTFAITFSFLLELCLFSLAPLKAICLNSFSLLLIRSHINKHAKILYDRYKFASFLQRTVAGELSILCGCELFFFITSRYYDERILQLSVLANPCESLRDYWEQGLWIVNFVPMKVFIYLLIALNSVKNNLVPSGLTRENDEKEEELFKFNREIINFSIFNLAWIPITFFLGLGMSFDQQKLGRFSVVSVILTVALVHSSVLISCGLYFRLKNSRWETARKSTA